MKIMQAIWEIPHEGVKESSTAPSCCFSMVALVRLFNCHTSYVPRNRSIKDLALKSALLISQNFLRDYVLYVRKTTTQKDEMSKISADFETIIEGNHQKKACVFREHDVISDNLQRSWWFQNNFLVDRVASI